MVMKYVPMTFEQACLHWRGRILTGEYAHLCDNWDGLPIDETMIEWPCVCALEMRRAREGGT